MESVSVPGRVLCSGDQATLLEDQVGTVSCAVDLRLHVSIESRSDNQVRLCCPLMSHTAPFPEVLEGLHDDALAISNSDRRVAAYPLLRKILDQLLESPPEQGFTIDLTLDDKFSLGVGLGSSTAFLVGLFAALSEFYDKNFTSETIATHVAELETELYEDARVSDAHVIARGGFVHDTEKGSIDHEVLSVPLLLGIKRTNMSYQETITCANTVQNTNVSYTEPPDIAAANTEAIWSAIENDKVDRFMDIITLSGSVLGTLGLENWPLPIARKRVLTQERQSPEKIGVKQSGFGDRSLLIGLPTGDTHTFTQAMDQIGGEAIVTTTAEEGIKSN